MANQGRTTNELQVEQPAKQSTTYSVKRANTQDERSQLVERLGVPLQVVRKPEPRWRVELDDEYVTLRSSDGTLIELEVDEARRIAEQILRRL